MIALRIEKGILWNIRNNEQHVIEILDRKAFMDAVIKTITGGKINAYPNKHVLSGGLMRVDNRFQKESHSKHDCHLHLFGTFSD